MQLNDYILVIADDDSEIQRWVGDSDTSPR